MKMTEADIRAHAETHGLPLPDGLTERGRGATPAGPALAGSVPAGLDTPQSVPRAFSGFVLRVVLPLPARILSPNHTIGSRGGRMAKAVAIKKCRLGAKLAAMEVMDALDIEPPKLASATVQLCWFTKTIRHPDPSNAIASCKAIEDGFTDAQIWLDDNALTWLPPIFTKDKERPRVEFVITSV